MAPRRGLKEVGRETQGKNLAGCKHGAEPVLDVGHDTPPKVLRSSPRLAELKEREGKDTPLGVDVPNVQTPGSINPRPKKKLAKKLENAFKVHKEQAAAKSMVGAEKVDEASPHKAGSTVGVEKVDEASPHKAGSRNEVESSNAFSMMPLPYVEIFLPDGRLARQCRASDECPGRFRLELVRWRMEAHLKREHGLEVHIPLRKSGRHSKAELGSSAKAPESRVDKVAWHKLAKKRFEDRDRKFALNLKKTEHLHRVRATEKWDKLKPEFRMLPKEAFVEKIVKERMSAYLASSGERLVRIQKRIDEGYDKHVSRKLPCI